MKNIKGYAFGVTLYIFDEAIIISLPPQQIPCGTPSKAL